MESKTEHPKQKEDKELIFLKLNSENIVEIEFDPALSRIKRKHLVYINERIRDLGGGKKMPAYISLSGFILMSRSAKEYRSTAEYAKYRLANAFLIDTFSKAILYNFYLESYTSSVPVNSFQVKEEAFDWLKSFSEAA